MSMSSQGEVADARFQIKEVDAKSIISEQCSEFEDHTPAFKGRKNRF